MGKVSLVLSAIAGSILMLTASTGGSARPVPAFELSVAVDGVVDFSFAPGEPLDTGDPTIVEWVGTHESPGDWSFGNGYHATADEDQRRVTMATGFVNLTDETHDYTITFRAPVNEVPTRSWMIGMVSGSLNDADFSGHAALSSNGGAGCVGLADDVTVLQLLQKMSAEVNEVGGGTTFGETAGLPPGTLPGPQVGSDIGVRLSFTLTPGDAVSLNASYLVVR